MKRHRTPASRWSASDRPLERRNERVGAVRCGEGVQLVQLRTEAGMSGGGAGDERLGDRPGHAELFLRSGFRADPPRRRGPRAAVVLVQDRGLAGSLERVLGMDHPGARVDNEHSRPVDRDGHPAPRNAVGTE